MNVQELDQLFNSSASIPLTRTITDRECLIKLMGNNTTHGRDFADALFEHGRNLTSKAIQDINLPSDPEVAIVDIPRGGVPLGLAVAAEFRDQLGDKSNIRHASSQIKTTPDNLIPDSIRSQYADMLVLVDGVVGSGKTVIDHLKQIDKSQYGSVVLISSISSEYGARSVSQYARENGFNFEHITGLIVPESQCCWQNLGGKQVYFVGYNPDTGLDLGIPDFGDAVQIPETVHRLYQNLSP